MLGLCIGQASRYDTHTWVVIIRERIIAAMSPQSHHILAGTALCKMRQDGYRLVNLAPPALRIGGGGEGITVLYATLSPRLRAQHSALQVRPGTSGLRHPRPGEPILP